MKVSLLGVDFFSDNRGCAALGYSAVNDLVKACEARGEKLEFFAVVCNVGDKPLEYSDVKYKLEMLAPKKLSFWKECYKNFKESDIVIDFTGGDSFSDIYGFKRFLIYTLLKELAILSKTKFVLGPQTIGPFNGKTATRMAKKIIKKSYCCFARDSFSQQYAAKLTGKDIKLSTDVAFSLPCKTLKKIDTSSNNIGINISGLLWYGTPTFNPENHLTLDYRRYTTELIKTLVKDGEYNVYLIPHVFADTESVTENDLCASREIQKMFPEVKIISDFETPMEAKGYIAQMNTFIGARMHATIAAFSMGVPVIPFSYSRKFEGLFSDLQYGYLVKGTAMTTEEALDTTLEWIKNPEPLKQEMAKTAEIIRNRRVAYTGFLESINR